MTDMTEVAPAPRKSEDEKETDVRNMKKAAVRNETEDGCNREFYPDFCI
jgi:hypothetical protein